MQQAEFDAVAADYEAQHARSIAMSGEETGYFSAYKVKAVRRYLAAKGHLPRTIMDFGAGIGNAVPYMLEEFHDAELSLLDVSQNSLKQAVSRASRPVKTVAYDGSTIPLEHGSFDMIFTACVFHHIDEDAHVSLLAQIRDCLAPGGHFFLFEHNPWNPLTRKAVADCPFDEHAVLISAPEMRRRLLKAGFAEVSLDYRVFFPGPLAGLRPLENWLRWCPAGAQYSLTARG